MSFLELRSLISILLKVYNYNRLTYKRIITKMENSQFCENVLIKLKKRRIFFFGTSSSETIIFYKSDYLKNITGQFFINTIFNNTTMVIYVIITYHVFIDI